MKILFLTHYFPPEVNAPASRTFEHCREWVAQGHEVHVVTCIPSHPRGVPFDGYRAGWYRHERMSGIEVHRVWTLLAPNEGRIRRLLNYLSYVPSAIVRGVSLGGFDVIVATSPQFFCAMAGWLTSNLTRTPWIFELRDLWPDSVRAVGAVGSTVAIRLAQWFELRMYRSARAVACVTRPFIEALAARGIDRLKLWYVPNGMETGFWQNGSSSRVREKLSLDGRFVASYVGTVGMAHGLRTLVSAAEILAGTRPDVTLLVVGDGAERLEIERLSREKGLSNLVFTGLVAREEARDILLASDVALVLLKNSPVFETVIPSKLLEAFAAGCPVVLGVDGEAKRILLEAEGGVPIRPEDPAALAAAIEKLAESPEVRASMAASAKAYVAREFDRAVWAQRFLDHMKEI